MLSRAGLAATLQASNENQKKRTQEQHESHVEYE